MHLTQIKEYPYFPGLTTANVEVWDVAMIAPNEILIETFQPAAVPSNISLKRYDLSRLGEFEPLGTGANDDRPFLMDERTALGNAIASTLWWDNYLLTAPYATTFLFVIAMPNNRIGDATVLSAIISLIGIGEVASLAADCDGGAFYAGMWDTNTIKRMCFDDDMSGVQVLDSITLDNANDRAVSIKIVDDILLSVTVTKTGVAAAPRTAQNTITAYKLPDFEKLDTIDVSGFMTNLGSICFDGNKFFYLFEWGAAGPYADPPPYEGNSPIHMHQCIMTE